MTVRSAKSFGAMLLLLLLLACDPGVHTAWKDNFSGKIDRQCVANAVKSVAGNVTLSTYVSDGQPFPKGTAVYQIWYDHPIADLPTDLAEVTTGYRVDIAPLKDGSTGYYHAWGKLGTDISPKERAYVVPFMAKVNAAVAEQCDVSVGNGDPVQGDG